MEAKAQRVSPVLVSGLASAALLVLFAATWFMLIAPKRAEATDLARQIEATRVLLATPLEERAAASADPSVEFERLAEAVPETVSMSEVVLELNRIAQRALVRIDQITPGAPVPQANYQSQPINVTVQGTFFAISDFVRMLRAEADLYEGKVSGSGRVYSAESLTFSEGAAKYPILTASISVSTIFGATAAPQPGVAEQPPTEPASAAVSP